MFNNLCAHNYGDMLWCECINLRSLLGMCGYYLKFINNFLTVATPMSDLTRKHAPNNVVWGEICQEAFQQLKRAVTVAPFLMVTLDGRTHWMIALIKWLQTLDDRTHWMTANIGWQHALEGHSYWMSAHIRRPNVLEDLTHLMTTHIGTQHTLDDHSRNGRTLALEDSTHWMTAHIEW